MRAGRISPPYMGRGVAAMRHRIATYSTPLCSYQAAGGRRISGPRQPIGMDLNRCIFSVIAVSAGSRSMLEAPKKPTTPSVPAST